MLTAWRVSRAPRSDTSSQDPQTVPVDHEQKGVVANAVAPLVCRLKQAIDLRTLEGGPKRSNRSADQPGAELSGPGQPVSAAPRCTERNLFDTADHIEKRLPLFVRHNGNGTLEGVGQGGGVFDALAIAACRDADLLECREAIESNERRLIALRGAPAWVHRGRKMAHGVPHRIVHDDEENRQVVQGSSMVDGGWITEEIGAIADDGNDRSLRSRKLGA